MDDLTLVVAMRDVLRLQKIKLGEAVHGKIGHELQHVRATIDTLPQERPVTDVATLFPRAAFVDPVSVFAQAETRNIIAGRGLSHLLNQ